MDALPRNEQWKLALSVEFLGKAWKCYLNDFNCLVDALIIVNRYMMFKVNSLDVKYTIKDAKNKKKLP